MPVTIGSLLPLAIAFQLFGPPHDLRPTVKGFSLYALSTYK